MSRIHMDYFQGKEFKDQCSLSTFSFHMSNKKEVSRAVDEEVERDCSSFFFSENDHLVRNLYYK